MKIFLNSLSRLLKYVLAESPVIHNEDWQSFTEFQSEHQQYCPQITSCLDNKSAKWNKNAFIDWQHSGGTCCIALCQNAFRPQDLLSFPSPQSITYKHLCRKCWLSVLLGSSLCDKWLFEDHTVLKCVGKAALDSRGKTSKGSPGHLFLALSLNVPLFGLFLTVQMEPSETDHVRFVRVRQMPGFFPPGQSERGH